MEGACGVQITHEVDGTEFTDEVHFSIAFCLDITQEAGAERVHERQRRTISLNSEIDGVMGRRDVAVDMSCSPGTIHRCRL